ncbi:holo-ACP synthase [Ideonella sp. YS5]|uniref:holo-ACP synthase n=1 Tax=Ideonella sp. YS5 TaxID=3453714 RepID=UPI003EEA172C
MPHAHDLADQLTLALPRRATGVHLGIDTVSVPAIADSLAQFGDRFAQRLFTSHEIADARAVQGESAWHERLAARFAVKEAVIKALDLTEAGIGWRDIELIRAAHGRPSLALHGRAAAASARAGVREWAVSISHDADQACAVVVGLTTPATLHSEPESP